MKLKDVLDPATLQDQPSAKLAGIEVTGITADSRKVKPGTVFFAMPGTKADGLVYAASAAIEGAIAIVADRLPDDDLGAPVLRANVGNGGTRRALALAASCFYPHRPATIVAITGTSGKTSASVFVRQIWHALGIPGASLGTIGTVTHLGARYGSLTTPGPVELHGTLESLAKDGVTHLAMEASSHGLDQHRMDGVVLKASAFLNLSRDHLDYHHGMADYFEAKMALFSRLSPAGSTAVIAARNPWRDRAISVAKSAGLKPVTVGRRQSDFAITRAVRADHGQNLTVRIHNKRYDFHLPLIGDFQASNALVAAALCIATGADESQVVAALSCLKGVSGRLETVGSVRGAPVLVDYAHKPAALASVLDMLRPYATGRLIAVFGCGGDRDKGKRSMMGRIAISRADVTIVTDDNPRSENPAAIRSAILASAPGAIEIADRGEAIRHAVAMLQSGDVLVIAGKGHEEGQIVGDVTLPFSDHGVAREAICAGGGKTSA